MSSTKHKPVDYINKVLLPGIEKIKEVEPFFCFSIIACSIEFLGSFYDKIEFGKYEPDLPYKRFKKGMSLFDSKYQGLMGGLYYGLRCGFAHQGKPNDRIALTTDSELASGDTHLKNIGGKGENECRLLVVEEFIEDFKQACGRLISDLSDKGKVDESKATKTYTTMLSTSNGLYSGGTFNYHVYKNVENFS